MTNTCPVKHFEPRRPYKEVLVFLDKEDPCIQPRTFRCCPLGVQFHASCAVEKYALYRILMKAENTERPPVPCEALVVHCEEVGGRYPYRVWLYFLDLPESIRGDLSCFASGEGLLCPFCMNF